MLRIVRAADWRPAPWKNGGGVTHEIAVEPAGASMDDLAWRLSAARVERAGPFSRFAGIDRTLCVLEGERLRLEGPAFGAVTLTLASAPFSFTGDALVVATIVGGSILDFNVMSRRGAVGHQVEKRVLAEPLALPARRDTCAIVCTTGRAEVGSADGRHALGHYDTLLLGDEAATLSPMGGPVGLILVWIAGA